MLGDRWFRFGLFLLFVGAAFVLVPPYEQYCERDYANQKYCAGYEISVAVGRVIEAHNILITALATVAIAAFTFTLWRSTRDLWEATRDQAALTRDALFHTERAFVFPKRSHWSVFLDPNTNELSHWTYAIEWENSGETPTRDMFTFVSLKLADEALPRGFDFPDGAGENVPTLRAPKPSQALAKFLSPWPNSPAL